MSNVEINGDCQELTYKYISTLKERKTNEIVMCLM